MVSLQAPGYVHWPRGGDDNSLSDPRFERTRKEIVSSLFKLFVSLICLAVSCMPFYWGYNDWKNNSKKEDTTSLESTAVDTVDTVVYDSVAVNIPTVDNTYYLY